MNSQKVEITGDQSKGSLDIEEIETIADDIS